MICFLSDGLDNPVNLIKLKVKETLRRQRNEFTMHIQSVNPPPARHYIFI